ncbi:hypothetical protein NDU88_001451 [Pleurodeles waltl]|uniref:Uncharacterized protein n=1 Tax=Pleurodeles waltl TaxID=8319 RepID=A0AAV7TK60_PLEWA|nr:hypothetical protein NDU88_001451 [Pleurodeles waltl]
MSAPPLFSPSPTIRRLRLLELPRLTWREKGIATVMDEVYQLAGALGERKTLADMQQKGAYPQRGLEQRLGRAMLQFVGKIPAHQ